MYLINISSKNLECKLKPKEKRGFLNKLVVVYNNYLEIIYIAFVKQSTNLKGEE